MKSKHNNGIPTEISHNRNPFDCLAQQQQANHQTDGNYIYNKRIAIILVCKKIDVWSCPVINTVYNNWKNKNNTEK